MSALEFPLLVSRKLLASVPASSPTKEKHIWWSSTYLNEGSLKSDIVVLLAAMICALISALCLNSLLRCARCYSRRMGVQSSDGVVFQMGNTGLKKAAIKALPIVVYTSASKLPPELATECPICLNEFGDGEKVRVLPDCNHGFHVECIDKWLASHSSCPLCRYSLDLLSRNRKPEGAAIAQDTESNNAIHVVTETTVSTQAIPAQVLERNLEEATGITTTLALSPSSVSQN